MPPAEVHCALRRGPGLICSAEGGATGGMRGFGVLDAAGGLGGLGPCRWTPARLEMSVGGGRFDATDWMAMIDSSSGTGGARPYVARAAGSDRLSGALLQEAQHVLRQRVRLGQHRGTGLLQDLARDRWPVLEAKSASRIRAAGCGKAGSGKRC